MTGNIVYKWATIRGRRSVAALLVTAVAVLLAWLSGGFARATAKTQPLGAPLTRWYKLTVSYRGDFYYDNSWFGGNPPATPDLTPLENALAEDVSWTASTRGGVLVEFWPRGRVWVAYSVKLIGTIQQATQSSTSAVEAFDYPPGQPGTRVCAAQRMISIVHDPRRHDISTEVFGLLSTDDNDALWINGHLIGSRPGWPAKQRVTDDTEGCTGIQPQPPPDAAFTVPMPIQPDFAYGDLVAYRHQALPPMFDPTGGRRFGAARVTLTSSYKYVNVHTVRPDPTATPGTFPDMISQDSDGGETFKFTFTLCQFQRKACNR